MKRALIKDPIYEIDLIFMIGPWKEYQGYLKRRFDLVEREDEKTTAGENMMVVYNSDGHRVNIVWLKEFDFRIGDYGTLAHEILHAAIKTMVKKGISIDWENQEPLAYYFDYLFSEAMRRLNKFTGGKKKKIK